ncbi:serine/threonine-protein kinase [Tumidithrix helvetica PCC 7403]|uniref:protein kinase domain-containing protein n=1 Tax=Tumidithrix helvetica TaxID=3457545 RepID=UPI003CA9D2D7
MSYCLNPYCPKPQNPEGLKFCQTCGAGLVLKGLYRAIAPIAQGGMGRTFRAVDLGRFDRLCAIKQFLPQVQSDRALQKATELFTREAEQLQALGKHPQIPELIAYFEQDRCLYLVQELIEGQNLRQALTQFGAFNEQQILGLLANLLPVIQFIHDRNVIHRDIKPENIIQRQEDRSYVLVDFGAAKVFADPAMVGKTGTTIGSAEYVAPEQARGKAVFQSDLYSLGVTCIHLLTNLPPFDLYNDREDVWMWRSRVVTPISETLVRVLDRMLERAIARRYPSAIAILQDLKIPYANTIPLVNIQGNPNANFDANPILTLNSVPEAQVQLGDPDALPLGMKGVNDAEFFTLQEFLAKGSWQKADRHTNYLILKISKKENISNLRGEDITKFPCAELFAIDRLWTTYSNGHFSFSVQKEIWEGLGGGLLYSEENYWQLAKTYLKFSDRVGWTKKSWLSALSSSPKWLKYQDLTFRLDAPKGHLPSLCYWEGFNTIDRLFYRLQVCKDN